MLRLFRVRGRSMLPTLKEGDLILARRLTAGSVSRLKPGQLACLEHPHFGFMVKRLVAIDATSATFDSDGQSGSEAASLGPVPLSAITHRVMFRIGRRQQRH